MARYLAFAVLIAGIGIVVFPGGGSPLDDAKLPTAQIEGVELVETISKGETVEIEDHLVPGQWTLVEFTAHW